MKTLVLYIISVLTPIAIAYGSILDIKKINREIDVQGYDVRLHSDEYTLFLGVENTLIQERPYLLLKKSGSGYATVSEGEVISVETTSKDQVELYKNPEVQIQLRKPVKLLNKTKQIVVFKFTGDGLNANKAIAFEEIQ